MSSISIVVNPFGMGIILATVACVMFGITSSTDGATIVLAVIGAGIQANQKEAAQ